MVIPAGLWGYLLPPPIAIVAPLAVTVCNLPVTVIRSDVIRFICIQRGILTIINRIIAIFRPLGLIVLHYPIDIQTGVDVVTVTAACCNVCSGNCSTSSCILIRCKANDGDSVINVIGLGVTLNLTNKRIQCGLQLRDSSLIGVVCIMAIFIVRHGARLVDHQHNIQRLGGRSRYLTRYVCLQLEFIWVCGRSVTS